MLKSYNKITILLGCALFLGAAVVRAESPGTLMMIEALPDAAWQRALDLRTEANPARLAAALDDPSGSLRVLAARRLAVLGPEVNAVAPRLFQALESDAEDLVRTHSASAIGRFVTDTTAAVVILERASREDESLLVRVTAGEALGGFGAAGLRAMLAHLARGLSCEVNRRYDRLLSMTVEGGDVAPGTPDRAVIDTLFAMVAEPRGECDREIGIRLLSHLQAERERAVPLLLDLLIDATPRTARLVVDALGLYRVMPGGRLHPGPAWGVRDDGFERYVDWARFTREHPGEDWWKATIAPQLEPIAGQLDSRDPSVQLQGLAHAWSMWDVAESLAPRAAELTASPDSTVRESAWDFLARSDPERGRRIIPGALRSPDSFVRDAAIPRVPEFFTHAEEGVALLRPLAESSDAAIRRSAVLAIANGYGPATSAIDILITGLDDPATMSFCGGALGSIGPPARAAIPRMQRLFDEELARAQHDTTGAYPRCVPIATTIAAIDSAAGREAARKLAGLDHELAREVSARLLDPSHPERAARRPPIPADELEGLMKSLSGSDPEARERARATMVSAGVAATAATPRVEALARGARGRDRGDYYEVLQAIDPPAARFREE